MNTIHVEASHIINAPAEAIYAVISDYEVGHRAILPKPYFEDMIVTKGGRGAGTQITLHMKAFGVRRTMHQIVTEPQPGRVLVESNTDDNTKTTFTFEPLNDGQQTRVTFATDYELSPGFMGFVERLINPPFMRRLYQQELRNLEAYVAQQRLVEA